MFVDVKIVFVGFVPYFKRGVVVKIYKKLTKDMLFVVGCVIFYAFYIFCLLFVKIKGA